MKLTHLRTNHVEEPLGLKLDRPIFSWTAEDAAGKFQTFARIAVEAKGAPVYDSGKREDISSLGFEAPLLLLPRTEYRWTVTVWDDAGDTASASARFETAKEDEPWQAKWIAAGYEDKEIHPLLSKDFCTAGEIVSARAYVCGLGIYELEINGKKAGGEYLLPGCHCYDSRLEYQTFDITGLLVPGENTVGLALGPGWYKSWIVDRAYADPFGDTMQAICELHLTFADGTEQVVVTDETWKCRRSPVLFSGIYDGEHYDARREIPGWSSPGCAADFAGAVLRDEPLPLIARLSPKIVKKQSFSPVEVIHTPAGETVLDFGQNMTGWVEFTAREAEGTEIRLSYGEVLQQGCFYRDNLRGARAEYRYTCDGSERTARPHFTFYGFRYVKVEGVSRLCPEDFTAWHIRSDIDPIGRIETGDPLVDRLFLNALWGQFDNFLDIPTDCPQRDERLGWTGDAAAICATACKNIYMPAFFHHYVENIACEQAIYDGCVPQVVPSPKVGSFHRDNFRGVAAWSDVAAILPWTLYETYGDTALLRREYPVMRAWVERVRRDDAADGDEGLWLRGTRYGDWLALDRPDGDTQNARGATDDDFLSTAYYYYSTTLTAKAAKALGYEEDRREYEALGEKIKAAFLKRFLREDGSLNIYETQTAYVFCLYLGLYPEGGRERAAASLERLLRENGMHLNTGFCGTQMLCRVLSANGRNDLACTLFLNDDYPSWLYEVKMGATTVWERWNSILPDGSISGTGMNSLNHYAYGSIVDWMYRDLCGLNPREDAPGYKKALIRPRPDPRIGRVSMAMDSAAGRYEVKWEYEGGQVRYEIAVPFDCEAQLILPNGEEHLLTAGRYRF